MSNLCIGFCTHGRCYHFDCPAASVSSLCQRPGKCSRVPREQTFRNFNAVMSEMLKKQYKQNYNSVILELKTKKLNEVIVKPAKQGTNPVKPKKIPLDELMSIVKTEGLWFQKSLIDSPEVRKQYGKIYVWNFASDDRLWTEETDPRLNGVNLSAVGGFIMPNDIVFVSGYLEKYIKTQPIPIPTKDAIFRTNLRKVFIK